MITFAAVAALSLASSATGMADDPRGLQTASLELGTGGAAAPAATALGLETGASAPAITTRTATCVDDPNFKEWNHLKNMVVEMPDGEHEVGTCAWFAAAPHWCHMSGNHLRACPAACSAVIPGLC